MPSQKQPSKTPTVIAAEKDDEQREYKWNFLDLPLLTSMPLAMRQAKKDLLDKPSKLIDNL